jgi:hypothetical protein
MQQPAVFRIKNLGDTPWIFPNGANPGTQIKFTVGATAGTKTDKQSITGIFRLTFNNADAELSIDQGFSLFSNDNRKALYDAFKDFIIALDGLEADQSLAPGGARLITQTTAQYLPLPLLEVALYYYNLVNKQLYPFLGTTQTYTDVVPGMRLQVYYSDVYNAPTSATKTLAAYAGTGSDEITVNSVPASGKVVFDAFLNEVRVNLPKGTKARTASGVADLMVADEQKPYNRLFYPTAPNSFRAVNVSNYDPLKNAVLVRAGNYKDLTDYTSRLSSYIQTPGIATQFFGRTEIVPEISVRINGSAEYVPVGTTLKQIVERELQSVIRPKSLRFLRMINQFPVVITFDDAAIGYNMFLVQGDDISW